MAVYFAAKPTTTEERDRRERLRHRLAFLRTIVDQKIGVAPTHAPLIDKLGGVSPFAARGCFPSWHERMTNAWAAMAGGPALEDEGFLRAIAEYVEDTGADWVTTSRVAAEFGPPDGIAEKQLIHFAAMVFLDGAVGQVKLSGRPSPKERFDAYGKLAGFHVARDARTKTEGHSARAPTPNDATDLNLMQHLAEGLIVATGDYRLIESVDASGSVQAPWVRTVGELLSGRAPAGPPWAFSAQKAWSKHRPRSRAAIGRLDVSTVASTTARSG